jgi:hypothetical protein
LALPLVAPAEVEGWAAVHSYSEKPDGSVVESLAGKSIPQRVVGMIGRVGIYIFGVALSVAQSGQLSDQVRAVARDDQSRPAVALTCKPRALNSFRRCVILRPSRTVASGNLTSS